ncbi:ST6GAL1 [Branchiostoma lanceolatum]|uniref:beta-galactoside alpha-(2,6)-sialyltransferase n=1 Tax=Branchiostoma lanceolatum TaxID=7740 RepID=A0A8K0AIS6_BRALA|nr:ST6GAL1 [Branchiostoma lanceolatum]
MDQKGLAFFFVILISCIAMYGLLGRVSLTVVMTSAEKSKPGMHFVYLGESETEGAAVDTRATLSCRLKNKVPFSTISRTFEPLQGHPGSSYFPRESLENMVHYNSCAVVSSSHAMKFHKYGKEIDAHDAVIRFNCAPTKKYVTNVGRRADVRLINTVIPYSTCQREFWDKRIKMFNNEIVVVRNFLNVRVNKNDKLDLRLDSHHSYDNYVKYRRRFPDRTMHFFQRPNFGADIKNELQHFCNGMTNCKTTELEKSPSTGAHGVLMMLHLCDWVYTYEFIPSAVDRNTTLAHYFDEDQAFTWRYHSYNTEREYWKALTVTSPEEVERTGVAVFRGLSQYNCT